MIESSNIGGVDMEKLNLYLQPTEEQRRAFDTDMEISKKDIENLLKYLNKTIQKVDEIVERIDHLTGWQSELIRNVEDFKNQLNDIKDRLRHET